MEQNCLRFLRSEFKYKISNMRLKITAIILFPVFIAVSCSHEAKDDSEEQENEETETTDDCKFKNDTYSATVKYHNPATNYSATYNLDVEVKDCEVVQINFPNDGYLDDDHISSAPLDENGLANVYGEEGKTYDIEIN